jgi:predicted nucleotidyltransferase
MFGLPKKSFELIIHSIQKFPEVEQAMIFGSRAKGNHKKGSDVDIAIVGTKINADMVINLKTTLNEKLPVPYYFDVIDYTHISEKALKEHIDLFGKTIYLKD